MILNRTDRQLFESLGGLEIVSNLVKAPNRRRDVRYARQLVRYRSSPVNCSPFAFRHKLLQLLHFYLLPEPEGDDRRDASEKIALLSAHLDDRIVAGLLNAFDLGAGDRSRRGSSDDDTVESEAQQGLAIKIASDTLMRSPRRKTMIKSSAM